MLEINLSLVFTRYSESPTEICDIYSVSMFLLCLSHSFVYLLYFCSRSKMNKQECSFARKGHGNGEIGQ